MPRRHLFELEDFSWYPARLRDMETDLLRVMQPIFNSLIDPTLPLLSLASGRQATKGTEDVVGDIFLALGTEGGGSGRQAGSTFKTFALAAFVVASLLEVDPTTGERLDYLPAQPTQLSSRQRRDLLTEDPHLSLGRIDEAIDAPQKGRLPGA